MGASSAISPSFLVFGPDGNSDIRHVSSLDSSICSSHAFTDGTAAQPICFGNPVPDAPGFVCVVERLGAHLDALGFQAARRDEGRERVGLALILSGGGCHVSRRLKAALLPGEAALDHPPQDAGSLTG